LGQAIGELFASESLALNSGHLWWQFLLCVTRRTLSAHPAFHPTGLAYQHMQVFHFLGDVDHDVSP